MILFNVKVWKFRPNVLRKWLCGYGGRSGNISEVTRNSRENLEGVFLFNFFRQCIERSRGYKFKIIQIVCLFLCKTDVNTDAGYDKFVQHILQVSHRHCGLNASPAFETLHAHFVNMVMIISMHKYSYFRWVINSLLKAELEAKYRLMLTNNPVTLRKIFQLILHNLLLSNNSACNIRWCHFYCKLRTWLKARFVWLIVRTLKGVVVCCGKKGVKFQENLLNFQTLPQAFHC
jgi:hypothetical protein